jgi:hypothetical protein
MSSISFGKLGLVVLAVWFHEALKVPPRLVELISHLINNGEIVSLRILGL